MENLRKPFFFAAFGALLLVLATEGGADLMPSWGNQVQVGAGEVTDILEELDVDQAGSLDNVQQETSERDRPGIGIPYLLLIDGILLFTVGLMSLGLFGFERLQGRGQGIATFIFSILLLGTAGGTMTKAIGELTLMVTLLTSPPFGTIAYMAKYASFNTSGAAVTLSAIVGLKFAFAVLLIAAHQRFLQNTGLVWLIIFSFLATIVVSVLHSLVPGFLVSITDAVAAIIVAIIALGWGVVLLVRSIPATIKAIG